MTVTLADIEDPRPFYEGAPAWYLRAARTVLPADAFPDLDQLPSGGHAVTVAHGGEYGRAFVQLAMDTPRALHIERPKSKGPGQRWDALIDDIANVLLAAGYANVRRANMGVFADVPLPAGEDVEMILAPDPDLTKVGVYHLTTPAHPHLKATVDGGFHGGITSGSGGYVALNSKGTPISPTGFRQVGGEVKAAREYAVYCGVPTPYIKVISIEAQALRILEDAYRQAGPGRMVAMATTMINGHPFTESAHSMRLTAGGDAVEPKDGYTHEQQKKLARLMAHAMNTGGGKFALACTTPEGTVLQRWNLTGQGAVQEPLSQMPPGTEVAPAPHLY
ncbi:hypothetical protein [Streptomyces sp. CS014]|uniref:hypothetical protein n=1 Tax=Streptomyces sp. CS014 TaxID=2162707 RepID=UPI000D50A996|nr:hypothetical protein [Streptomyces sp. CS014]PVD04501.1 hypothetical protein DBP12_03485 [Streptomyces sp. CS014]